MAIRAPGRHGVGRLTKASLQAPDLASSSIPNPNPAGCRACRQHHESQVMQWEEDGGASLTFPLSLASAPNMALLLLSLLLPSPSPGVPCSPGVNSRTSEASLCMCDPFDLCSPHRLPQIPTLTRHPACCFMNSSFVFMLSWVHLWMWKPGRAFCPWLGQFLIQTRAPALVTQDCLHSPRPQPFWSPLASIQHRSQCGLLLSVGFCGLPPP